MGNADRTTGAVTSHRHSQIRVPIPWKNGTTVMNLQAWSDQALHALNSTATIVGLAAAAVVLLCIGLIYFSGSELTARIAAKGEASRATPPRMFAREQTPQNGAAERQRAQAAARASQLEAELETARHSEDVNKARAAQLERELSEARLAEKTNAARLSQLQSDLSKAQQTDEQKDSRTAQLERDLNEARLAEKTNADRLAQLQSDLSKARQADEQKASRVADLERQLADARLSEKNTAARLAQLETDLGSTRRADEEKGVRLAQMEMDLKNAKQSTDLAKAEIKRVESADGPRVITPEERKQFIDTVRGLPTGKVLVSAFFENAETHQFGAELLNLLKTAGFSVIERAPLNFFTTSRPHSGVRIGCQDINNPPPHFETVRKALESIGLEASTTNIVNADEEDVVEIQVTPRL